MIAEHHDNFDCWNSRFNRWNSVNMGPRRDIAGEWKEAANKQGLRFGMTEHLAASWWFYGATKSADKIGPMAGVPYDGNDPKYADLYWSGNDKTDFHYYGTNVPTSFKLAWFKRIKDMIDRYHPDLLYSDSPLPYPDEVGRRLLAHYYNDNLAQHGGRMEAVYNCKQDAQGRWVRDLERGVMEGIHPEPWQTDTCVGGWYYDEKVLERHGYKTPAQVIHMLCDIVSKNGNLLLNFPPRPDGTLDEDELKILDAMAAWIAVNGEAIYGTRPWKVFGEGPTRLGKGWHGGLSDTGNYKSSDIRFTQSKDGRTLYAIVLGTPDDNQIVVRSLASAAGKITDVTLLGHTGELGWQQTDDGLVVKMPAHKPCNLAYALKIAADTLKPVPVVYDGSITRRADGRFVLPAAEATIHGDTPQYEHTDAKDQIGCWARAEDFVSWNIKLTKPGTFAVEVTYSCAAPGSEYTVEVSGQKLDGKSASTGSWESYRTDELGTLKLAEPGTYTVAVKPKAAPRWRVIGLKAVVLHTTKSE
jgi:alpha-L-fucosidase